MLSILDVFNQVCTDRHQPPLIAISRHKDVRTALRYLASAYGTIPEKLAFTPDIEAGYREQLRTYFDDHRKGQSTTRNTLQYLAQLWKAFHTLNQTPRVPPQAPTIPGWAAAVKQLDEQSPYRHYAWLNRHPYRLPPEQWPVDIAERWNSYAGSRTHDLRPDSLSIQQRSFACYVSYQIICPKSRINLLPPIAQDKLQTTKYVRQLTEISNGQADGKDVTLSWDQLFDLHRLNSYITWNSWRVWRWHDAALKEKMPHRPSMQAYMVARTLHQVAKHTMSPELTATLLELLITLQQPIPMHDKKAPIHRFELAELETIALTLIAEARAMCPGGHKAHPGAGQAVRFQVGLMLQLMWRNPLQARNWCEAILGLNLIQEDGQWRWHFAGDEMKVGMRGTRVNVFEPDVPVDVAPHLDEFLAAYRPQLPNAVHDRHVFLSMWGTPLTIRRLLRMVKGHVSRFTGKAIYTHLLRSLFSTHHLSHGMDINSVAYAMNDTPQTVLKAYNELMAGTHRPIIAEANRAALASGHKPLTPPVIPITPKPPKPAKTDPNQMALI